MTLFIKVVRPSGAWAPLRCDGRRISTEKGKVINPTFASAVHAAARYPGMTPFPCTHCGGWHTGHPKKGDINELLVP